MLFAFEIYEKHFVIFNFTGIFRILWKCMKKSKVSYEPAFIYV